MRVVHEDGQDYVVLDTSAVETKFQQSIHEVSSADLGLGINETKGGAELVISPKADRETLDFDEETEQTSESPTKDDILSAHSVVESSGTCKEPKNLPIDAAEASGTNLVVQGTSQAKKQNVDLAEKDETDELVSGMAEKEIAFHVRLSKMEETVRLFTRKMERQDVVMRRMVDEMAKRDSMRERLIERMEKQDAFAEKLLDRIEKQDERLVELEEDNRRLREQLRRFTDVDDDRDEDICIFCRENLCSLPTTVLRCGHSFHQSCLSQCQGRVCPLCRTPFEEEFPPLPSTNAFL